MEANHSLENLDAKHMMPFFKKLCLVNKAYSEKLNVHETTSKKMLSTRIQQLEDELEDIKKEKDTLIFENKKKINDLSLQMTSLKSLVSRFLAVKKRREERVKELEKTIKKTTS